MKRILATPTVVISCAMLIMTGCQQTVDEGDFVSNPTPPETGISKSQAITFTGNENHKISPNAANQMTSAFQAENPYESYGWYFGREAIERILARDGVIGIRFYGGLKVGGDFSPVLAGTMADGRDFLTLGLTKSLADSTDPGVAELAFPCPPFCP